MTDPLPKDSMPWLPTPENEPPIEERAKNLVRHFLLILAVLIALALPVLLARISRS